MEVIINNVKCRIHLGEFEKINWFDIIDRVQQNTGCSVDYYCNYIVLKRNELLYFTLTVYYESNVINVVGLTSVEPYYLEDVQRNLLAKFGLSHLPIYRFVIDNICGHFNLGYKLDLEQLCHKFKDLPEVRNVKFNLIDFPAVYVRFNAENIKGTAAIFKSGKVVILGVKTKTMLLYIERKIRQHGKNCEALFTL